YSTCAWLHLHSSPTRRSSDLIRIPYHHRRLHRHGETFAAIEKVLSERPSVDDICCCRRHFNRGVFGSGTFDSHFCRCPLLGRLCTIKKHERDCEFTRNAPEKRQEIAS